MAVASTPTLLSLDRFAAVLGLHPLHFNQVDANIGSAQSRVCIHPIRQYSWQEADGVSREELALSIMEAEDDIAAELGYPPMPTWYANERIELVRPHSPDLWYSHGYDVRGDIFSTKAQYGKIISGGWRAKTLIDDAAAIVYTDTDSDGYFETATVGPIATTVLSPSEIAIYYPGLSGADEWEIRPTVVTISGGNVTIVFRREQAVIKTLLESLDSVALDGLTNSNFLTTVDVYRKYNDPNKQVEFVWRSGVSNCDCADVSCCTCSLTIQNGCMTVKDHDLGIVTMSPGEWNNTTGAFDSNEFDVCRRPDYVRLWYYAGLRDQNLQVNQMSRRWELAIAKLAISKLDRLICSCKAVSDVQSHWSADLRKSRSTSAESYSYKATNYELENNPFGTTVAAQDVWRLVRREQLGV